MSLDFIENMKKIQKELLEYIDNGQDIIDFKYPLFISLEKLKEANDLSDLKSLFYLIITIANNHHRCQAFYERITQILSLFSEKIQENFSNTEIFEIFKSNKRILLFLLDEQILTLDNYLIDKLSNDKYFTKYYTHYFYPELSIFISKIKAREIYQMIPKDSEEIRKTGENNLYICQLIREDSIEEFIRYINQKNISLETEITESIFETNSFLIGKKPSLIEYAAFFGSIQIFQYLNLNNVKLEKDLWLYSIHGNNGEIIHLLEENNIQPNDKSYQQCFKEAIKCHHNNIADYIQTNYINNDEIIQKSIGQFSCHYCNYQYFPNDFNINSSFFIYLCQYNYFYEKLVKFLIKSQGMKLNNETIFLINFSFNFNLFYFIIQL